MSDIPEEAFVAAEEALRSDMWDGDPEDIPPNMRTEAELAVDAAAPFIRADERRRVAAEVRPLTPSDEEWQAGIKSYQDARGDGDVPTDWDYAFWDAGYKAGVRKAAQIAETGGGEQDA